MSTPPLRGLVDYLDVGRLLLEQIRDQNRLVAFRTGAAQSQRPTEEVALRTATLADETLLAL